MGVYTLEDLNSHASGVLFICFKGNVTRKPKVSCAK